MHLWQMTGLVTEEKCIDKLLGVAEENMEKGRKFCCQHRCHACAVTALLI